MSDLAPILYTSFLLLPFEIRTFSIACTCCEPIKQLAKVVEIIKDELMCVCTLRVSYDPLLMDST